MLHPAVQIYIWICFALATQMLDGYVLAVVAATVILLSLRICAVRFLYLLRRTRWILASLFVIFAYTSPGDAMWPQWGIFSPGAEGVEQGLLQLSRLLALLAALSILLSRLSQLQLIAGLYVMSRPLAMFGLSPERMAVRLALTLRYADSAMRQTAGTWREGLDGLLAPEPVAAEIIELHVDGYSWRDWLVLATASAGLLGIWLEGVWR